MQNDLKRNQICHSVLGTHKVKTLKKIFTPWQGGLIQGKQNIIQEKSQAIRYGKQR